MEGAGPELGNRGAGRRLRARDDLIGQLLDVDQAITLAHRDQTLTRRLPARDLRRQIAEHRIRRPYVRLDQRMQHRARLAGVVEFQRRNPEPFFVHVAGAGTNSVSADVGVMNRRSDIGEDAIAVEDRRQHRDVEEMPGRQPRVVGGDHITRPQIVGENAHEMRARNRQRIDVTGRAGVGLRHHAAAPVEQRARQIARFAHHRTESNALQSLGALGDDADQVGPEDFEFDAVHRLIPCAQRYSRSCRPSPSSRAVSPSWSRAPR